MGKKSFEGHTYLLDMEKDTQKGTLLLNCVDSRQPCTLLSSNSMLMALCHDRKVLVVHERLRPVKTAQ